MKKPLLALGLLACCNVAFAQHSLVQDIYIGPNSSAPSWLTEFNGKLIFAADDGTNGRELWMLDSSGTSLVFNINPGANNSIPYGAYKTMAMVDSMLYFPADDGTNGTELYKWDGSGQPGLAAEIRPGNGGSGINELIVMDGKIYFSANDGTSGYELWEYDPATNTAQRLSDIYTGIGSANPSNFTIYDGKLYFTAIAPSTGEELYMYDPATNNTSLAVDIYSGAAYSNPSSLMVINNKLYFNAYSSSNGREIYSFDGKNAVRVTDMNTGSASGVPSSVDGDNMMIMFDGNIYFSGNNGISNYQLFKYNPSNGSASLVYNIHPIGQSNPGSFIEYAWKLYFVATDAAHGRELWSYDGKNAPMMVADIYSGTNSSNPANLMIHDSTLYFTAMDSATGMELYRLYDSAVTVQNVRFEADVKVYPNPANSVVYLDMNLKNSEKLAIRMADASGRMVYYSEMKQYHAGNNKVAIPMDNLPAGVYFYNIISGDGAGFMAGRVLKQ